MTRGRRAGFVCALVVVASAGELSFFWQQREAQLLHAELELVRMETVETSRLAAENERLRAQEVSAAELERLRADRAAIVRLRAELEELRKK